VTYFVLGKEVEDFERRVARMLGVKYVVGVNSGTDALFLSMKALGIREREVITPPNSYIATTASICTAGNKPIFVDVDHDENVNPSLIRRAISQKTKAIVSVHLRGLPCKMDEIMEISAKYNLIVIEDCSQAILARYNNKFVGTLGNVGSFSLNPTKILGADGDAGMIITNDKETYHTVKLLRNHGLKNRDISILCGYRSRIDTLQAAILNVKLKHMLDWIEKRRKIAKIYLEKLNDLQIHLPFERTNEYHVYTTFTIRRSLGMN
jgi:dTDP-4-amino-4,6-dideoxygalactose transaminase